ncbi:hypothetical protein BCON_0415g00060 [Botryotinia convoluta]|uniref:Uncharacterized protein n=1 Tax=Botryotinia convoluta TaxID=54673 RepID=A0A4Z1H8W3_9HELO|nr:hypothetical protein BCON_0415g00060 [Botryotinia convoluta]
MIDEAVKVHHLRGNIFISTLRILRILGTFGPLGLLDHLGQETKARRSNFRTLYDRRFGREVFRFLAGGKGGQTNELIGERKDGVLVMGEGQDQQNHFVPPPKPS